MYEVTLLRASWSPTSDEPVSEPVAVAATYPLAVAV